MIYQEILQTDVKRIVFELVKRVSVSSQYSLTLGTPFPFKVPVEWSSCVDLSSVLKDGENGLSPVLTLNTVLKFGNYFEYEVTEFWSLTTNESTKNQKSSERDFLYPSINISVQ